jgi:threonine dehydratase
VDAHTAHDAADGTSAALVTAEAVRDAAALIRGAVRVTPVLHASTDTGWRHLRLKCENLQVAGSFKARGASHFLRRLDERVRARGVITYSSGNHGQALAWAARTLGVPAVVVMPTTAPAVKVEGAKALGAEVHFAGTTSLDRQAAAEALAVSRGLTIVPPFDHPHIIEGQGTAGLELIDQQPDVTAVYVPVGGGGLVSGVAAVVRQLRPGVRIVGAEPAGAAKMSRSLAAGEPVTLDRIDSIADGLLALRPGVLTFAHVRAFVDEVVTVTDDELRAAMRWLALHAKVVAEPSGAAAAAAAMRLAPAGSGGVHVAVVSGGNVEPGRLREVLV